MVVAITLLLALAGIGLALQGVNRGQWRHRLFAVVLGSALALPAVVLASSRGRAARWLTRAYMAAGGTIAALALGEALVRGLDLRAFRPQAALEDPELGYRLAPERGELDEWGFRNAGVPDRAEIVCLGDSQTYGVGVRADEAWPAVLARESGTNVYAMALGGYGPIQALVLAERALELSPRVIVYALYLGNDVQDAWRFAGLPRWKELQASGIDYPADPGGPAREGRAPNLAMAAADALEAHSRLLGRLLSGVQDRLKTASYLADVHGGEGPGLAWEEGPLRTQFTPAYRLRALDLAQPDVRDGLRITELCLGRIAALTREHDCTFVLLLLPTKERVYHRYGRERDRDAVAPLDVLAAAEEQLANELLAQAGARKIVVIDPLDPLVSALERGEALWPPTPDGHFTARGQAILGGIVRDALP